MPLISVITITKNNPDGFARTKASVQAQVFKDYEWVVIDGEREPDNGIYDAMNKGIDCAIGEYLIFMNAGDVFAAPDVLTHVAKALKTAPDFVYGDAIESGYIKRARHSIAHGMVTHHQAMVYRKSALRYDTRYSIAADYKFTAQVMMEAANIVYLPVPLCVFETGGISQQRTAQGRREQTAIRHELGIKAPLIGVVQFMAVTLKRFMPRVYWMLRSCFSTSRA